MIYLISVISFMIILWAVDVVYFSQKQNIKNLEKHKRINRIKNKFNVVKS